MKQPSKSHYYAIGHDILGSTFVAIKVGRRMDYIYGMFKGRELLGGHLDDSKFESWHREGERVGFTDHPVHGNIVLVLGRPGLGDVTEITGPEADAFLKQQAEADPVTPAP